MKKYSDLSDNVLKVVVVVVLAVVAMGANIGIKQNIAQRKQTTERCITC